MERDVSGTRQRMFFQSICPASRPRVNGTGPKKKKKGWILQREVSVHPKILMKDCTVKKLRTLSSSDRHQPNPPALTVPEPCI